MKVLAAIDIMNGDVVRLTKGDQSTKKVYSNDPVQVAKKWAKDGADMLHIVDLDAAFGNESSNLSIISEILHSVNIPIQIGGGIRNTEIFEKIVKMGFSKIVVGTMAYRNVNELRLLSKNYGDKIVISLDEINGKVMIEGWKSSSDYKVEDAINKFNKLGISNFLLTSIIKDGTLSGPDIVTLNRINTDRKSKIIASGGISSLVDVLRVRSIGCDSIILGKALYEERLDIKKVKAIA
ncbi:MAG: 1-(5-phosphoribosyl)-5-[(5-phosphoribosylamino)methylideneamino]imidazole-4-carboxamide isomerase [Nitrososphaeraceae archaeon]|nr:1-(5-phosphoribosyl)-5-[(5-phosphoribosylamino)methylideneamino]imidazole-4-carboxamide isomerase [Nitrososphaeraceae archaeon]MDW0144804.1 1-(5-phosphoribosyl)-5-[(5-phosphoribosylamino)methylideneamino]imidazole-4-carboxamide isomerase [Nitrososphaeraceae archaeon]MDW0166044.1 1-(5-phosphoribosyl)-5-[(5-phosphoribosylamino)methylideneamino]imidazole-4-carboxamide isomerase [Nitrososphaeraceae archaeon]MDW3653475.1 1-(5-phosphoribosyl)-5-[(5-phosphoribosylamino)methylideneamino]imidazole-4-c